MSLLLIDTNVASFIFKGSSFAQPYQPLIHGHELALSFITVAELFQWSVVRNWGDRRTQQLERYLSNYLVIPVDQRLCWQWVQIWAARQKAGQPISSQDAWVTATTVRHELPLITHNIQDFQNIADLQVLEPDV